MAALTIGSGLRIGYEERGHGEPVVLLPGTAGDHSVFVAGGQIPALARRFRVVALDHRGTGESTRPEDDYRADDLVADVVAAIDALELEQVHLIGLSMGAGIAMRVAASHPNRVGRLVLYHPWLLTDEFLRRMFTIWRFLYAEGDVEFIGQATLWFELSRQCIVGPPAVLDGMVQSRFAGPNAPDRRDFLRHVDINLSHDVRPLLRSITAPTLVVSGEQDRVIPPDYSEAVATAIPGASFRLFRGPGSGHGLFLERSSELNAFTAEFLAGATSTSSAGRDAFRVKDPSCSVK